MDMLTRRHLHVATQALPHGIRDLLSIDHIAVSGPAHVKAAQRFDAEGLSDHDGYVIDTYGDLSSALS